MIHAKLVSFTRQGAETVSRLTSALNHHDICVERYNRTTDPSLNGTSLSRFAQQAMADCDCILFVGAVGIAVRAIAPYLTSKASDPAVLAADEAGRYIIPLLSGHLGGANAFAQSLAAQLGAQAIITTATDNRGVFAVDTWAKEQHYVICEPEHIRYIAGALLRGETVGMQSQYFPAGPLPPGILPDAKTETGICIGYHTDITPYRYTLHLIPRRIHAGVGCRRGTSAEAIEIAVSETVRRAGIAWQAICSIASIDTKKNEPGLLLFCQKYQLPFRVFSGEVLQTAPGAFTASAFVEQTVGVDNVCERAAVVSAGNGRLLRGKTVYPGVTVALAEQAWQLAF